MKINSLYRIMAIIATLSLPFCKSNKNDPDPIPPTPTGNGEDLMPMEGEPGIIYKLSNGNNLPQSIILNETETTNYMIILNSQPSDDVEIEISLPADSPDNLELSSGGETADMANEFITLTFTDIDWDSSQMVTLTLGEDNIASGDVDITIMHASSSSDLDYNSIPGHDLMVTAQDNEIPTVTITATVTIDEGDSGDISVSISHEPTQNVEITLTGNPGEASISPGVLTFTPSNWNTPKTATVTITDDAVYSGDRNFMVSYSATVSNTNNPYHSILISNTTVTIMENETPCDQPGAGTKDNFTADMSGENYGTGEENDPYIICNAMQLQFIGIGTPKDELLGAFYELGKDIDASSISNFSPIGTNSNQFTGTLDGKGFTISDLRININLTTSVTLHAGLFGYTGGSEIRNIGLLNVDIDASSSGSSYAGGLVGLNDRSSSITNSYSTGNVSSSSSGSFDFSYVGGLVGINNRSSSITNSYSTGNVSSSASYSADSYTGGLVGQNDSSSITNSYYNTDTSILFRNGSEVSDPNAVDNNLGTLTCVGGFLTSQFIAPITPNTGSCSPLAIFFNWQTPFDIDGDSAADEESVRYDINNDGNITNTDDFVWNFGTTSEYPFIAYYMASFVASKLFRTMVF